MIGVEYREMWNKRFGIMIRILKNEWVVVWWVVPKFKAAQNINGGVWEVEDLRRRISHLFLSGYPPKFRANQHNNTSMGPTTPYQHSPLSSKFSSPKIIKRPF